MKCQRRPLGQWSGCLGPNVSLSYLKRVVAVLQCGGRSPLTEVAPSPFPSCPCLAQRCQRLLRAGGGRRGPNTHAGSVCTSHARPRMGMGALPSGPSPLGALPGRGRQCGGRGSLREDRRGRVRLISGWQASHPVPASHLGSDRSGGPVPSVPCGAVLEPGKGGRTPGQEEPSLSEAPPSPPTPRLPLLHCNIYVSPLTWLMVVSSCRHFKPVTTRGA